MQKHNQADNLPNEHPSIKLISDLISTKNPLHQKWLPRHLVMEFLGYGDTQMSSIQRRAKLQTAKVGKRLFYSIDSILKLLDSSVI